MKLKNLRIKTQLRIGFAVMLLFVIALGIVSYFQSNQLYQQAETMYNYPLQVRRAIGYLKADILSIQHDTRGLFLAADDEEIAQTMNRIETSKVSAFEQIDILYSQFLGPRTEIDSVKLAFITSNSIREETVRLLRAGNKTEAINRTKKSGISAIQAEMLLKSLERIDIFSKKEEDKLYTTSKKLNDTLNRQLFFLVAALILLSALIIDLLLRSIRRPIEELTNATQRFHNGDMTARSSYVSKNEFGILSDTFNTMAQGIEMNMFLNEKVADLAGLMLSEEDAKNFFHNTINALAAHTGSQMAAVFLLSEDKKLFEHFESIGLDSNARHSFAAGQFEGEFGTALASHKVQHIKKIPKDTRLIFHTVSGTYIPREIITIPILAINEVIAVISLASLRSYSKEAIQLIDNILVTLNARVEGILAYRKMKELSEKLVQKNLELEMQKVELSSQSAELTEQNTELEMQKEQLGEANRLKTVFLSNMSHELRTPLNSVIALSGVLNRRLANQIPEEEHSYLEVIERNGKHLLDLINDILDISRIEAGREELEVTTFNANALIAEVVSMIYPQAEQKKIDLLHKSDFVDLQITSDARKCRHILQNLIGNAVKFTEKGKVEISAQQTEGNLAITVTDTGIGISSYYLPHIFDEFRQADDSASRKFGGTGLGLAIAKKYANMLGGKIIAASTYGKGSDFTLIVPLHYKAQHRKTETQASSDFNLAINKTLLKPALDLPGKTILLVEDSESAIIQIKDFLEESGYQMLVAHDGAEALAIVSHTIPDAIILDLMMPGIDGFEVLKILRNEEHATRIPVLILTAKHVTKEELKSLKENNIYQLIQKGDVNRKEMLKALETMTFPEAKEVLKPQRVRQAIVGKPVVLVVEDNPDNMLALKALLADDYIVIEANDGNEGVEKAKTHKPNLILMDIALPEMDGIEAFKDIRKDAGLLHIPVVALTASAMTADRENILSYGFDAFLAKPIDEQLFFKTINEILYGK